MKVAVLVVLTVLASASAFSLHPLIKPQFASGDIISGVDAEEGEAPYIVSFKQPGSSHFCGGSIIAENWVLTAAHCLVYKDIRIVAGLQNRNDESQVQIRSATENDYRKHALYGGGVGPYDIGLIYVAQGFDFSELRADNKQPLVQPVQLPKGQYSEGAQEGVLFGWGKTSDGIFASLPNTLQKLDTYIIGYEECKASLPSDAPIDPVNVCSTNGQTIHSACNGDSGGPLVQYTTGGKPVIIGIVSWGYTPCTTSKHPSVYTSTGSFTEWIEQNKIPTQA